MARKSRQTKQKDYIAQALAEQQSFFSAQMLHKKVSKYDSHIGIATIYRYLHQAKRKKELKEYTCDRRKIYSKNQSSHCHYTCEKTGKSWHIEVRNLDFLKDKLPGSIVSFQLEVRGICHDHKS